MQGPPAIDRRWSSVPTPRTPLDRTPPVVRKYRRDYGQYRTASVLLGAAATLQFLTPFFALLLLKLQVEEYAHTSISWSDFFWAINTTGLGGFVYGGIVAHIALSVMLATASFTIRSGWLSASGFAMAAGVVSIAVSLFLFGGFLGAVAGGMAIAGGMAALARPERPQPVVTVGPLPPPILRRTETPAPPAPDQPRVGPSETGPGPP